MQSTAMASAERSARKFKTSIYRAFPTRGNAKPNSGWQNRRTRRSNQRKSLAGSARRAGPIAKLDSSCHEPLWIGFTLVQVLDHLLGTSTPFPDQILVFNLGI